MSSLGPIVLTGCLFVSATLLIGADVSPKAATLPEQENDDGYVLIWSDEFDKDGPPDPANWIYERGFARNKEAQWYQPANAIVQDGMLVIEARRERLVNPSHTPNANGWRESRSHVEYTSASIKTAGKHAWTYGRFEMRARIDARPGLWPAWWTVGTARPWPGGGEIDMMEYYRGMLLANACWKAEGGRWAQHWDTAKVPLEDLGDASWSEQFHVWEMLWDEDSIELSVDGRLLNTIDVTKTVNPDGTNPFKEPHHMILNLAIGGTNGGDPVQTAFPGRFEVDYVRVYQRPNLDSSIP